MPSPFECDAGPFYFDPARSSRAGCSQVHHSRSQTGNAFEHAPQCHASSLATRFDGSVAVGGSGLAQQPLPTQPAPGKGTPTSKTKAATPKAEGGAPAAPAANPACASVSSNSKSNSSI